MNNKSCSMETSCQYKTLSTTSFGCNYQGYCDFQRPRDSRPPLISYSQEEGISSIDREEK